MAALKRRIDGKDNSMEEDQFILQNVQKKVNFELHEFVEYVLASQKASLSFCL